MTSERREETGGTGVRGGDLVFRHRLATRLWHWLNVVAVVVLLMSGLTISNAHPFLYWGEYGANFDRAWLDVPRFPGWMTIPSYYDLALARRWHLFVAWPFAFGLLIYLLVSLFNRHIARDLTLSARELAPSRLWRDIKNHVRLNFPTGQEALSYNILQKIAYVGVIFGLLPILILTGLSLSPGFNAVWPGLLDLFGGRASARSLHFISAGLLALFAVGHLLLVLLAGPYNQMRGMITGRYRIPPDRDAPRAKVAA